MAPAPLQLDTIVPGGDTLLVVGRGEDRKCIRVSAHALSCSKVFSALLRKACARSHGATNQENKCYRIVLRDDDPVAMNLVLLFLHGKKADRPESMKLLVDVTSLIRKYELVGKMGYYLEYIRLRQHGLEAADSCSAWFNNLLLVNSSDYLNSFQPVSRLLVLNHDVTFVTLIDMGLISTLGNYREVLLESFKIACTYYIRN